MVRMVVVVVNTLCPINIDSDNWQLTKSFRYVTSYSGQLSLAIPP